MRPDRSLWARLILLATLPLLLSFVLMGTAGLLASRQNLALIHALVPSSSPIGAAAAQAAPQQRNWMLLTAATVFILAAGLAAVMAARLTRPLNALKVAAGRIAAGDLDSPVFVDESIAEIRDFALTLERLRLGLRASLELTEARQRVDELTRLNEITQAALSTHELQPMLEMLADRMGALIGADGCYITLWDEERQEVIPAAAYGPLREIYPTVQVPPGETTMTESVLRAGRPLAAEDVFNSPYLSPRIAVQFPARSLLGLPLIAGDQKLGAALIAFNQPHHFTPEEIARCERAAGQVALAVARTRLLETERRQRHLAETLRDVAITLNSTLDLTEILERLLERLEQVIPYDSSAVMLVEEDHFRVMAGRGFPNPEAIRQLRVPVASNALFNETKRTARPLILSDAQADPRFQSFGGTTYVRAWIGVPLISRGEVIGHLTIDSRRPNAYSEANAKMAAAFASYAVTAIENARLYTAEKLRARELGALHAATAALLTTLDLETLLDRILAAAIEAIPAAEKGTLLLLDCESEELQIRAARGYNDPRVRTFAFAKTSGYSAKAVREGRPLLIPDVRADASIRYEGDLLEVRTIQSAIVAPLLLGEQALGALSLDSTRREAFTEADLRLLVTFAATATAAIRNAQLHAETQRLARIDALTGLSNRRYFFELAEREVECARRYRRPLAVIMFDLDHFKRVNDTYGHAIGDQVLAHVAACGRRELRHVDLIGRYGGEEFVALLLETEQDDAVRIAERLRQAVESATLETERGPVRVTVSLGVASLDEEECPDLETLLLHADQALYTAKQVGGNQVMVIGSKVPT